MGLRTNSIRAMAILNAALDDVGTGSGTSRRRLHRFSNDWVPLSEAWAAVLGDKGLASLHTADYLRASPPAEGWTLNSTSELISAIRALSHEGAVFGMCVGVEHAA